MELIRINATEGMVLTNGETYGKSITLGKNDSRDNWHEITEEEYEAIKLAEHNALVEQIKAEERGG